MCRLLLTHSIDPVSFSLVAQVVFEQQTFKVLKSIKFIEKLLISYFAIDIHAINSNNRAYVCINCHIHV